MPPQSVRNALKTKSLKRSLRKDGEMKTMKYALSYVAGSVVLVGGLIALALTPVGCGNGSESPADMAQGHPDGGVVQHDMRANPDMTSVEPDCFDDPMTNYEIINACTTAEKIKKTPVLPLLKSDGTLPPLP